VLCLLQAGWAVQRPNGGMPAQVDAVEGWIASAGALVGALGGAMGGALNGAPAVALRRRAVARPAPARA